MKTKTLQRAVQAAQQFIMAAAETKPGISYSCNVMQTQDGGKDVAATKRASMDLTRALADLRGGK